MLHISQSGSQDIQPIEKKVDETIILSDSDDDEKVNNNSIEEKNDEPPAKILKIDEIDDEDFVFPNIQL